MTPLPDWQRKFRDCAKMRDEAFAALERAERERDDWRRKFGRAAFERNEAEHALAEMRGLLVAHHAFGEMYGVFPGDRCPVCAKIGAGGDDIPNLSADTSPAP